MIDGESWAFGKLITFWGRSLPQLHESKGWGCRCESGFTSPNSSLRKTFFWFFRVHLFHTSKKVFFTSFRGLTSLRKKLLSPRFLNFSARSLVCRSNTRYLTIAIISLHFRKIITHAQSGWLHDTEMASYVSTGQNVNAIDRSQSVNIQGADCEYLRLPPQKRHPRRHTPNREGKRIRCFRRSQALTFVHTIQKPW